MGLTYSRRIPVPDSATSFLRGSSRVWIVLVVLVAAEAILEVVVPTGHGLRLFAHDWLHDFTGALAALVCVARVVTKRDDRWAWGAIATGLVSFATGQVLWSLIYRHQPAAPDVNFTDVFYLALYPLAIVGLGMLIRAHLPRFEIHRWLDGIIVVLIVAAVAL